ncbi:MAG: LysR family transcriptional regulator [Pseudomonadales bacterium]
MNLHDLEAFRAVADCSSFSKAAEQLHLTQPAVSKRIQALEARLQCRLFDRVGKRIYLTAAGEVLRPRADALLRALQDAERELQDLDRRVAGVLGLATSHHVGLHRLAPALRTFTRQYPDVQLDIRFEDSEDAHELVRRAATEIAVVTLNPKGDADLDCCPLWDDPLVFVAAAGDDLTRRGRLSLSALAESRPVLPGLTTYTGRIVVEAFARAGLVLRPNLATNYLETIAMLVSIGLGWSLLPRSMIRPPLTILDTEAPPLRRTLGYVTNPGRTPSNAARAFQQILLSYADEPGT